MSTIQSTDELYGLLDRAGPHRPFAAGEHIFEKGEEGHAVYIVRAGSVALKDGEKLVETVTTPGLFGELALIENEPRALSAVADGDCELVEIPARRFWVLVHETPYFAHLVMTVMAHRLRAASQAQSATT